MRGVIAAKGGEALRYASDALRSSKSIALCAIAQCERTLDETLDEASRPVRLSDELRDDLAVVMLLIWFNPSEFKQASARHRNNPDIFQSALESVAAFPPSQVRERASRKCRVMACVGSCQEGRLAKPPREEHPPRAESRPKKTTAQRGARPPRAQIPPAQRSRDRSRFLAKLRVVEHAGHAIRDDEAHVLDAITQISAHELGGASARVRDLSAVCLAAVSRDGDALASCSDARRDDEVIVQAAVEQTRSALQFASARTRDLAAVCLAAVTHDGAVLASCSDARRDDEVIVRAAISQTRSALQFASARLKVQFDIVQQAISSAIVAGEKWR